MKGHRGSDRIPSHLDSVSHPNLSVPWEFRKHYMTSEAFRKGWKAWPAIDCPYAQDGPGPGWGRWWAGWYAHRRRDDQLAYKVGDNIRQRQANSRAAKESAIKKLNRHLVLEKQGVLPIDVTHYCLLDKRYRQLTDIQMAIGRGDISAHGYQAMAREKRDLRKRILAELPFGPILTALKMLRARDG